MSYKPDETVFMAYLYDELNPDEKLLVEKYLSENPDARKELEQLQHLRRLMTAVEDKEVIAPPIVVEGNNQRFFWNAPYVKTIMGLAASLLLLMVAGKLLDVEVNFSNRALHIGFGETVEAKPAQLQQAGLSAAEVQAMINTSMEKNTDAMTASINETQQKLDESISRNLNKNSATIKALVQQASLASQDEVRRYVAGMQNQNQQAVKDYFQLTTNEQQKYIESLLVDFSKYMQQQRNNDLQVLQTRLQNVEQNTTVFKQETEQILASIISSGVPTSTIKNY
jgi:hypothetical protein